jgi:hypothetical protein
VQILNGHAACAAVRTAVASGVTVGGIAPEVSQRLVLQLSLSLANQHLLMTPPDALSSGTTACGLLSSAYIAKISRGK